MKRRHYFQIPSIKQAKILRGKKPIRFIGSAWTAPPWMKNFKVWQGFSQLEDKNYQLFANYMKKFLDEYKKNGINFWGLTTGNEPLSGFLTLEQTKVNSMGWTSTDQVKISWHII